MLIWYRDLAARFSLVIEKHSYEACMEVHLGNSALKWSLSQNSLSWKGPMRLH